MGFARILHPSLKFKSVLDEADIDVHSWKRFLFQAKVEIQSMNAVVKAYLLGIKDVLIDGVIWNGRRTVLCSGDDPPQEQYLSSTVRTASMVEDSSGRLGWIIPNEH